MNLKPLVSSMAATMGGVALPHASHIPAAATTTPPRSSALYLSSRVQLDECGTICSAFLGRKSLRFLQNGHVSPCLRCPKFHKILMISEFEKWNPYSEELKRTAAYIAQPGKGILASDESNATTGKRLATVGLDNTEANRQAWRELLYSAPGLGNYISGTIMFEETLFQSSRDGIQFVEILKKQGIVPGIKVDTGLQPIDGTDGETATQGLDGLGERCKRYYAQGARFAKWRAVIKVDSVKHPSSTSILENAHGLARYAHIAQANGLVPIVEPEVTLGPGDYR